MATAAASGALAHDERLDEIVTGEAVALDLRPASFVLRAAGAVIDWLVYFGGYLLLAFVFLSLAEQFGLDEAASSAIAIAGLVIALVVVPTAVETLSHGKSLGKLAVGARIVRDDGGSIGLRHAFIRALTGVFETYMTFGGMAAIVGLLGGRAKRLGDLVAGTYSQYERVARLVPPAVGMPPDLVEWSRTADVARLPDALARRVAQFLAQAAAMTPASRSRLARELANEVAGHVSPLPASDAEPFLAAVAVVRREREFAALELEKAGLERLAPVLGGMPRGFPDRG